MSGKKGDSTLPPTGSPTNQDERWTIFEVYQGYLDNEPQTFEEQVSIHSFLTTICPLTCKISSYQSLFPLHIRHVGCADVERLHQARYLCCERCSQGAEQVLRANVGAHFYYYLRQFLTSLFIDGTRRWSGRNLRSIGVRGLLDRVKSRKFGPTLSSMHRSPHTSSWIWS